MKVTAEFEVTGWKPVSSEQPEVGPGLSRVEITKSFGNSGLVGASKGEGLFCGMGDPEKGAGYVVSERFTGELDGRSGTFVLQHGGLMGPGMAPHSFGNIVPGSGTGDLEGVSGTMEISRTDDGAHLLTLEYDL